MKFNDEKKSESSKDTVPISVQQVSKKFRLWEEKESTLKSTVINIIKKRKLTAHEFWSLKDINFEVKKGETLGIIGSNGSGKSTLLKILAGIIYPTEGKLDINGRVSTLFELGTGFHPELSGRDNVYLNGSILGLSRKEVTEKFDSIVEFAELKEFIDMPLKHYSSGMQMRLAFAVAISVNPDILLVDEVLAVGDAAFQAKSYAAFQDFKKKGATIIFVTHDLNAVKTNCDRVLLINKGQQVDIGKPPETITKYQHIVEKTEQEHSDVHSEETDRHGDGKATIEKAWIENEHGDQVEAISDNTITIKVSCQFNTQAHNPIFGLIISDQLSRQILTTNTLWKNIPTGSFEPKDKITITYKIPNIFEHGNYYITAGIAYPGAARYFDYRDRFVAFRVQKPYLTGYLTNPPSQIILDRSYKAKNQ